MKRRWFPMPTEAEKFSEGCSGLLVRRYCLPYLSPNFLVSVVDKISIAIVEINVIIVITIVL
jgi:hypothetical protein